MTPVSTTNAAYAYLNKKLDRLGSLSGLTIENGMTAGYGVNDGHTANPKFDPRIWGGPTVRGQKMSPRRVGVLRNVRGTTGKNTYSLFFMFNPTQIQAAFGFSLSQTPAQYVGAETVTAPNMVNSQSVGWSLFFDRTYEMMYGPNPQAQRGVLADVAALYNLLGTFDSNGATPMSMPVKVVFGINGAGQLWGFTGFLSSVTITYGIFRHDMIPSRCEVDLTMTTTYVSAIPGHGRGHPSPPVSRAPQGPPARRHVAPLRPF